MGPDEESVPESLSGRLLRDGPATTAPNRGKRCQCGMGPDEESVPEMPAGRAAARRTCHNGTESLKTLPLRKDVKGGVKFVKFVGQSSVESVTEDY